MHLERLYNFEGKTALITGASSGLGKQFARILSNMGVRVIMVARSIDKLEQFCLELDNTKFLRLDVRDSNAVNDAFAELDKNGEKIDICINNAGIAGLTPIFEDNNKQSFEDILQTNVTGIWNVTKAVAKHMKSHGVEGSIINIGSINGDMIPAKEGSAYSVSKASVIHLTKTLVNELAPHKIRINCISPGWVNTPMNKHIDKKKVAASVPCGYIAEPSDLDGLILCLSSNKASRYVNGAIFTIDGGASCRK